MITRLPLLFSQITVEDLQREAQRLQHDYTFLSYGLTAAWVITVIYVLMMVGRQRKLKQEIANLKAMLEEKSPSARAR
jgi:CcmD family protein